MPGDFLSMVTVIPSQVYGVIVAPHPIGPDALTVAVYQTDKVFQFHLLQSGHFFGLQTDFGQQIIDHRHIQNFKLTVINIAPAGRFRWW